MPPRDRRSPAPGRVRQRAVRPHVRRGLSPRVQGLPPRLLGPGPHHHQLLRPLQRPDLAGMPRRRCGLLDLGRLVLARQVPRRRGRRRPPPGEVLEVRHHGHAEGGSEVDLRDGAGRRGPQAALLQHDPPRQAAQPHVAGARAEFRPAVQLRRGAVRRGALPVQVRDRHHLHRARDADCVYAGWVSAVYRDDPGQGT